MSQLAIYYLLNEKKNDTINCETVNCKLKTEISPREMRRVKKKAAKKVELIHILGSEITVSSRATAAGR